MYSQCPTCQAIFRVSESDLGAHHGLVRCGHCSAIFHALTNEVDDARVSPDNQVPGRSGSAAPPAGEQVGAERADDGYPAGAPSTFPDRHDSDTERSPGVQEDREWTFPAPDPESRVADDDQDTAIEPVLRNVHEKQTQPPAEQPPAEPPPAEESPAEESPAEESPAEESPAEEPPAEEPPAEEPPAEEPPAERPSAEPHLEDETALPGEITEEITIEAPPVLWNVFDEETNEEAERDESSGVDEHSAPGSGSSGGSAGTQEQTWDAQPAGAGQTASAAAPQSGAGGVEAARRTPLRAPYRGHDITMVELPQPRPFKTATLSLLTVLLALLLVWQAKTFYLAELAQVPVLRPHLEFLCRPLACVLPPRRDFARIDLVGTSIDVNPEYPGALEITASLINRAHFPQPYPPLRVTLSDREGRVVGRRTYLPSEYRAGNDRRLPTKEARDVSIKLAQPAESAVGYEVELMTPVQDGGG